MGGLELGLERAGFETAMFSEIDPAAVRVLSRRFPGVPIKPDIREIKRLPRCDVVCAGFPCTDLSQAGGTTGISGANSGLVSHLFRLLEIARPKPEWVVVENVPFMLRLQSGRAMRYLVEEFERLGYAWAYRVVDTRSFGLPQRRRRVILIASRSSDPSRVVLADDAGAPDVPEDPNSLNGFYWTEGNTGIGWATNAVPTLKGGSGWGIPSPPAIVVPSHGIGLPDIRDAERLQGFPAHWTAPGEWETGRRGTRWKLVGNAVSVPVAKWIGRRLIRPSEMIGECTELPQGSPWPIGGAHGRDGRLWRSDLSEFPVAHSYKELRSFLKSPVRGLSHRATKGFRTRLEASSLREPPGLVEALRLHEKTSLISDHREMVLFRPGSETNGNRGGQ